MVGCRCETAASLNATSDLLLLFVSFWASPPRSARPLAVSQDFILPRLLCFLLAFCFLSDGVFSRSHPLWSCKEGKEKHLTRWIWGVIVKFVNSVSPVCSSLQVRWWRSTCGGCCSATPRRSSWPNASTSWASTPWTGCDVTAIHAASVFVPLTRVSGLTPLPKTHRTLKN